MTLWCEEKIKIFACFFLLLTFVCCCIVMKLLQKCHCSCFLSSFFAGSCASSYIDAINSQDRLEECGIVVIVSLSDFFTIDRKLFVESLDVFLDARFGTFDRQKILNMIHETKDMLTHKCERNIIAIVCVDHTNQRFHAV